MAKKVKSAVKNEVEEEIVIDDGIQDGLLFLDRITIKKDFWSERNSETEQAKKIMKEEFYSQMNALGLDLDAVSNGKRIKNEAFHRFNIFVSSLIRTQSFHLSDIAIFLEEDYFDFKVVLNCFNEENLYLLREEMATKLPVRKTTLRKFIEQDDI